MSLTGASTDKKSLRQQVKAMRLAQEAAAAKRRSDEICDRLLEIKEIRAADRVFVYAAARGEADLEKLVYRLWDAGKCVAFPACQGERMDFYAVSRWEELREGYFAIREPIDRRCPLTPTASTVICTPGVVFSAQGNRIGMGKGFYDRYFSRYPMPYRIGIAFDFQCGWEWEPDRSDVPMHMVMSEKQILR